MGRWGWRGSSETPSGKYRSSTQGCWLLGALPRQPIPLFSLFSASLLSACSAAASARVVGVQGRKGDVMADCGAYMVLHTSQHWRYQPLVTENWSLMAKKKTFLFLCICNSTCKQLVYLWWQVIREKIVGDDDKEVEKQCSQVKYRWETCNCTNKYATTIYHIY